MIRDARIRHVLERHLNIEGLAGQCTGFRLQSVAKATVGILVGSERYNYRTRVAPIERRCKGQTINQSGLSVDELAGEAAPYCRRRD
jgi:hypothetical protein